MGLTALSAQNIFSQAMLMLIVLLQQMPKNPSRFSNTNKMACFYKQKSLRNKAVLWQKAKRNERNVAHIYSTVCADKMKAITQGRLHTS